MIGVGASSAASADDVPLAERQFTIRLQQISALDETGPFNVGLSDQFYAGFQTSFVGGRTHEQTGMLGDFDVGETRTARADQRCLMPIMPLVNNGDPEMSSGFERYAWGCTARGFNAHSTSALSCGNRTSTSPR